MSEDYATVIAALPRLSPEERAAVSSRLAAMRALSGAGPVPIVDIPGPVPPNGPDPADEVLDAVVAVVLRASGERVTVPALRRVQQFRVLRTKLPELMVFLMRHAPDRVHRRRLLEVGFDLLYKSMRGAGHPITARTLMMHAHRLPAAIDAAFPGYAAAGALGMVLGVKVRREGDLVDGQ